MVSLSFHNKRVLVIDDQRPFLILLRGMMNNLGALSVVIAQNGESAIAACRQEKFDIIICDLHLGGDKKNGYQLLEELRVRKLIKSTTVYMMVSADSERPMVLGSIERQPDDYLIKPFSQAQLSNRLLKAYQKRRTLAPIYDKIMADDYQSGIQACKNYISTNGRHTRHCLSLLIDLLWRVENYQEARDILEPIHKEKPLPWSSVALAKTYLHLNLVDKAFPLAQKASQQRLYAVEGLDVLAQCYVKREQYDEALQHIKAALNIAPFSLNRQYLGCEIARLAGDFEMAKNCCQAILEQSKKSVHRSISHLCNYIRSILDAADRAEDKKQRNKYQQEAMLMLQRNKNDELLSRVREDFDYGIFEELINARINILDGKMIEAKRSLNDAQYDIKQKFEDYPLSLAPDSITLMSTMGEFEDAAELLSKLKKSEAAKDPNLQFLIQTTESRRDAVRENYNRFNKEGIEAYSEGKYQAAYAAFQQALELAPMNTGVTLNLLQCLLKLLEKNEKSEPGLLSNCRQIYRMVDGMRLPENHQAKLDGMKDKIKQVLERR
ncbi:response regulator [Aliiglaciecola sp. CAU 1673]|uniref:tetratricopeptide repeat-containing response regulator n=1 Tax=Aliiglaciecola sp. CAU 1673 TaxID=3032595 RepID=UPI0023D9D02A|nr:tetratricopeptide repeat-containing response regulator [Aliiglaciecola sp. CAU 1673]MDF2177673.1 response regulator [Aliiglaciecola sp. CAU 1673]